MLVNKVYKEHLYRFFSKFAKMERMKAAILSVVFMVLINATAIAQCAMCRATAESATENVNKGIGEGLNSGIVYLMLLPYLLLGTVAVVFFRKKILGFFKPGAA
jgi:hypothetical protein